MSRKLFAPLLILATAIALPAPMPVSASSTRYVYTDLGVLGGLASQAWSLNNQGQVVGHADTAPGSGRTGFHAFLWNPTTPNGTSGVMIDLGALRGDALSNAFAINDSGQVVGVSMAADGTRAFIYDGSLHELGDQTTAYAINNLGRVAGSSQDSTGVDHPFLWVPNKSGDTKGRFYDLGVPAGSPGASASAINSEGTVVGGFFDADFYGHAFVWLPAAPNGTSGVMTALVEPAGTINSFVQAINDDGLIVGTMNNGVVDRGFVYGDNAMHDLGTFPGGTNSFAYDINSSGQIVGYADTAVRSNDHAFIYEAGVMTDLNKLLPGSVKSGGVVLTAAYGINDAGQIVGAAIVGGQRHGFLLTPA